MGNARKRLIACQLMAWLSDKKTRGVRAPSASVAELEELIKTRCWLEEIAQREISSNHCR